MSNYTQKYMIWMKLQEIIGVRSIVENLNKNNEITKKSVRMKSLVELYGDYFFDFT